MARPDYLAGLTALSHSGGAGISAEASLLPDCAITLCCLFVFTHTLVTTFRSFKYLKTPIQHNGVLFTSFSVPEYPYPVL